MTLHGVMALTLRYFIDFGSFRGQLRKTKVTPRIGNWVRLTRVAYTRVSLSSSLPTDVFRVA